MAAPVVDAIKSIAVQGTKAYILPVPAAGFADCAAAVTGIMAGSAVICPQAFPEVSRSRSVTEKKCLSSNASSKTAGAISWGDGTFELMYSPDDTTGIKALADAFENNTPVIIGFMADYADTSVGAVGASGTLFWFETLITSEGIKFPDGDAWGLSYSISPYGILNKCPAVPGTA